MTNTGNNLPASFTSAWETAAEYLQTQRAPGTFQWARNYRFSPLVEHLSFWLGNQFFFVFIELPEELPFAGETAENFLQTAAKAKATPCLFPMLRQGECWVVRESGWGLIDARSGAVIDPPAMVTQEPIEMSDYECQALAVTMVVDKLRLEGKEILSCHPYPETEPSLFFKDGEGFAWVAVNTGIYPNWPHDPPKHLIFLARSLAMADWPRGFYAPVGLSSQMQDMGAEESHPLWRVPGLKGGVGDLQELPQRTLKHLVRERNAALFDEILRLFYDFDPGQLNFGNNFDEYEAETATIIERLPEADSLEDFNDIVEAELDFWFSSIRSASPVELAEQIWRTWLVHQAKSDAS
jgi:hypothetical protein